MASNQQLREALIDCIELIEKWAYGPLFRKAGIRWPHGVCQAPALLAAKELIKQNDEPLHE